MHVKRGFTTSLNAINSLNTKPVNDTSEKMAISIKKLPRARLANLPTPLEEMTRLSRILAGPKIWIKRDDCTGLTFGGSKVRALEFAMADAINKGADTVITTGDLQSNHAHLTAAAARKLGLKAVLVLEGRKPKKYEGNLLLSHILGADIRFGYGYDMLKKTTKELKDEGHVTYIVPSGGSSPIGTIGYVNAALELQTQAKDIRLEIDYIAHATASGGTQTGLTVGNKMLNTNTKVIGVTTSVGIKRERLIQRISQLASDVCKILNADITLEPEDLCLVDYYSEEKYDTATDQKRTMNAIMLVAQTEGILLDPIYTGKAMAVLIDMAKQRMFDKEDNVVFIHTGGTPALSVHSRAPPFPLPYSFVRLYSKYTFLRRFRDILPL